MADYTLDDIEKLRKLSGITYQEAIAVLDYHRGDLAKALEDLRRNGRIQPEGAQPKERGKGQQGGLLQKLYAARVTVRKGDKTVLNVSSVVAGVALLVSPYVVAGGAVASLALGYRFGFNARDEAFMKDDVMDRVRDTADKVKHTVDSVAQQFKKTMDSGSGTAEAKEPLRDMPEEQRPERRAPVIQIPVKVETPDGSVSVTHDQDGFMSATIE